MADNFGGLTPPPRRTRQWVKLQTQRDAQSAGTPSYGIVASEMVTPLSSGSKSMSLLEHSSSQLYLIPDQVPPGYKGLKHKDRKLLTRKRDMLQKKDIPVPRDFQKYASAIEATLVFGQEEAGTAVCISPCRILLTCAHCVAESRENLDLSKVHWLLFASGGIVSAECVAWDDRRDLALLKITATQAAPETSHKADRSSTSFPHVNVAENQLAANARLICVGHPGSEDLEAEDAGVKTNYDVLHLSTGLFRGYAADQDVQDNSEIGALKHDCWTYWGHSGAPLLGRRDGQLIGLHSSWDGETGMRRGVPLEAIKLFLEENKKWIQEAK